MFGDCHIHMILDGVYYRAAIDAQKERVDEALVRARLEAYRDAGVRFLRDGGDAWGVGSFAARIAGDYGLDYRTPAFPIHRRGHYGGFIGRGWESFADYQALLAQAKAEGADFIKLMVSGLMDFSAFGALTEEPLTGEEMHCLVAAAHDQGFAVMAHCNGAKAAQSLAVAGVDSIEHGAYLDDEACHALAENGVVWVPTLSTIGNLLGSGRYDDAVLTQILRSAQENVRKVAALGGFVGLGSDAGAFRVPHVAGALSEEKWLRQTLGEETDAILTAAEKQVKSRFQPAKRGT